MRGLRSGDYEPVSLVKIQEASKVAMKQAISESLDLINYARYRHMDGPDLQKCACTAGSPSN